MMTSSLSCPRQKWQQSVLLVQVYHTRQNKPFLVVCCVSLVKQTQTCSATVLLIIPKNKIVSSQKKKLQSSPFKVGFYVRSNNYNRLCLPRSSWPRRAPTPQHACIVTSKGGSRRGSRHRRDGDTWVTLRSATVHCCSPGAVVVFLKEAGSSTTSA